MARGDPSVDQPEETLGAYGLRLSGISKAVRGCLAVADPSWPELRLSSGKAQDFDERVSFTEARARVPLPGGGEITAERSPLEAVVRPPELPREEELLHPYLGYVAAMVARWLGRDCVHAGAFVADGAAWAFVGKRGSGKTSLLAWLVAEGYGVVCDDVLVIENQRVFAAPRFLDLRGEAAFHLGVGRPLGTVGSRERWRLRVGQIPAELPLRGWIFLDWASDVAVDPLSAAESVIAIRDQLSLFTTPRDPESLLDLAMLPAWRLGRPRRWESMAEATAQILQVIVA